MNRIPRRPMCGINVTWGADTEMPLSLEKCSLDFTSLDRRRWCACGQAETSCAGDKSPLGPESRLVE